MLFAYVSLGDISNLIAILTPLILLFWFYYSQKQSLSKDYFAELPGIYAGQTKPNFSPLKGGTVLSGIIMNIRDVDKKGFFKGEFDYGETESCFIQEMHMLNTLTDGLHTFFGECKFKIYRDIKRHTFSLKKNRTYYGSLYIIGRLDFNLDNYKIEDYVIAEYDLTHYREMRILKFVFRQSYQELPQNLPKEFILYKSAGLTSEPYETLKKFVFKGKNRVDK